MAVWCKAWVSGDSVIIEWTTDASGNRFGTQNLRFTHPSIVIEGEIEVWINSRLSRSYTSSDGEFFLPLDDPYEVRSISEGQSILRCTYDNRVEGAQNSMQVLIDITTGNGGEKFRIKR